MIYLYSDRRDAGKALASQLEAYTRTNTLVVGIVRDGVHVAEVIARKLQVPLDTVAVCPITPPNHPACTIGALASHDTCVMNQSAIDALKLTEADVAALQRDEVKQLERLTRLFGCGTYTSQRQYDTIIVADDGLSSGAAAEAAILAVRQSYDVNELIFAAPVCPYDTVLKVEQIVDACVCRHETDSIFAVGYWYRNFEQLSDSEVLRTLTSFRLYHDQQMAVA